jgi:hypothetical protein
MSDPLDIHALDEIKSKTKTDVEIAVSTDEKIQKRSTSTTGSLSPRDKSLSNNMQKEIVRSPLQRPLNMEKRTNWLPEIFCPVRLKRRQPVSFLTSS